jgi:hypothetical protein
MTTAHCNDGTNLIYDIGTNETDITKIYFNCETVTGPFNQYTNLAEIDLTGVTSIAENAFRHCLNLTTVNIPASVTTIGANAFNDCYSLATVTFEDGSTLNEICEMAFYGSAINSISIPASVTTIGYRAFANCKILRTVYLSQLIVNGGDIFKSCTLTYVDIVPAAFGKIAEIDLIKQLINAGADVDAVDDNGRTPLYYATTNNRIDVAKLLVQFGADANIRYEEGVSPLSYALKEDNVTFYNLFGCFKYTDDDTLRKYKYTATKIIFEGDNINKPLSGFTNLREVDLTGVVSICDYAFTQCHNLTVVTFGEGLTSIGEYAFTGTIVKDVTIPSSVTSLGKGVFGNCSALQNIIFEDNSTLNNISESAFIDTGLINVVLPNSVKSIGDEAFNYCRFLKTVIFGTGVEQIGYEAFHCSGLTSVNIPDSVNSIDAYAFSMCDSLTTATIGKGLTSIPDGLFNTCSALTKINIPDNIKSIGKVSFYDCHNITNITIPASTEKIDENAFADCFKLKTVHINGNPNIISAFGNQVETLTAPPINAINMFNLPTLKNLTILKPTNNEVSFHCSEFTGNLTFSNGIKDVELTGVSNLKTVRLPVSCLQFTTDTDIHTLCIPHNCNFSQFDKITSCIRVVKPATTSFVEINWTSFTKQIYFEDNIEAIQFAKGEYNLSSLRIPETCQMINVDGVTFATLSSPWFQVIKEIAQQVTDR